MIASIGSNICPILALSGFAESPGPSASFAYGRRDYWRTLWLSKRPAKLAHLLSMHKIDRQNISKSNFSPKTAQNQKSATTMPRTFEKKAKEITVLQ